MKKTKYTEEHIVGILKEVEAGITVAEICRKYGISDATYYNWKAKYGGMTASEIVVKAAIHKLRITETVVTIGSQIVFSSFFLTTVGLKQK